MSCDAQFFHDGGSSPAPDDFMLDLLEVDYYREPDNVMRGVSLLDGVDDFVTDMPMEAASFRLEDMKKDMSRHGFSGCNSQDTISQCGVPSEPPDHLESTHFILPCEGNVAELFDCLLEVFATSAPDVAVEIFKVNRMKLSIKAHGCMNYVSFSFKVRIYQQKAPCQTYIIELQRRSGDGIAFHKFYIHVAKFAATSFTKYDCNKKSEAVDSSLLLALPDESVIPGQACLDPWLEIVENTQNWILLQEASSNIANLVATSCIQNHRTAATLLASLVSARGLAIMYKLLESDQFSIAYPTACLLAILARHPEIQGYLATHHFLSAILEKMLQLSSGSQVWLQLAHVLNSTVTFCATNLYTEIVKTSASSIRRVIKSARNGEFQETAQALNKLLDLQH